MDRLRITKSDILCRLTWTNGDPTQIGIDLAAPSFVNFKGWGFWFLFEIAEIPHPCETRKDGAPSTTAHASWKIGSLAVWCELALAPWNFPSV